MSLPLPALLAALGQAQGAKVAPMLEGSYAGGEAGTIALLLILLAQDAATLPERTARETAAMAALLGRDGSHRELLAALADRHAALDAAGEGRGPEARAILSFLVEMADAGVMAMPAR